MKKNMNLAIGTIIVKYFSCMIILVISFLSLSWYDRNILQDYRWREKEDKISSTNIDISSYDTMNIADWY